MIIANQKKRENLAEYIIYIWQLEDLIRAWEFDIEKIKSNIVAQYHQPETVNAQIVEWYKNLMRLMEEEGKKDKGHCSYSRPELDELEKLHDKLVASESEFKYNEVFTWAKNPIRDFRLKAKLKGDHDITVCFNALYSLMASRMKHEKLNPETEDAFKNITNVIALLASIYKKNNE
jgi:hypothetical protein